MHKYGNMCEMSESAFECIAMLLGINEYMYMHMSVLYIFMRIHPSVCVCACVRMRVCVRVRVCACMCACVCEPACMYEHVCVNMRMRVCVSTCCRTSRGALRWTGGQPWRCALGGPAAALRWRPAPPGSQRGRDTTTTHCQISNQWFPRPHRI